MKKLSLPVIGGTIAAGLALGVGGAAASGAFVGPTEPVSDESVNVAPTAEPTQEAPVTEEVTVPATTTSAPVTPPVGQVPAATVEPVPTPTPQAPAGEIVDPESIGTTGPDGNYTPAPEPNGIPSVPLPPAPGLPTEPDYVPRGQG